MLVKKLANQESGARDEILQLLDAEARIKETGPSIDKNKLLTQWVLVSKKEGNNDGLLCAQEVNQ